MYQLNVRHSHVKYQLRKSVQMDEDSTNEMTFKLLAVHQVNSCD